MNLIRQAMFPLKWQEDSVKDFRKYMVGTAKALKGREFLLSVRNQATRLKFIGQ